MQKSALFGVVVFVGLIVALGLGSWYFQVNSAKPVADPYAYENDDTKASESTLALSLLTKGSTPKVFELTVPEFDQPLAKAEVLELASGRNLIVGWESQIAEPVLRSDVNPTEELGLIKALNQYLPMNSTVLAMPTLSDRLNELSVGTYPFASLAALQAPTAPEGSEKAVLRLESKWLGDQEMNAQPESFQNFIEALVSEDLYGAARLQALAGGEAAYVILHIRDSFDIGTMLPEKLHVGLRDFPGAGHAHDMTRQVKTWVADEDFAAYAVQQINGGETLRAYFLAEGTDKATLLGQLLPFNTSRIGLISGTKLVFQVGGYWAYRIDPVD
ncbi:MAG: hydroxylamine oxidation protein HaoB [Yoonia sp.]|jgi:hydroxylamine oxidation protein HaoB